MSNPTAIDGRNYQNVALTDCCNELFELRRWAVAPLKKCDKMPDPKQG
jgi:hypothetical protein